MFGLEAELSSKHPEAVSAARSIAKRETKIRWMFQRATRNILDPSYGVEDWDRRNQISSLIGRLESSTR